MVHGAGSTGRDEVVSKRKEEKKKKKCKETGKSRWCHHEKTELISLQFGSFERLLFSDIREPKKYINSIKEIN